MSSMSSTKSSSWIIRSVKISKKRYVFPPSGMLLAYILTTSKIIPRAVDYFTGKALELEDLDDDDDDYEDLDDDDDDDEDRFEDEVRIFR